MNVGEGGYVAMRPSADAETSPVWPDGAPDAAPPLFLVAASNDPLIEVRSNSSLHEAWYTAGRQVELHLYAQGGHGFGVTPRALLSDTWIDRFWEWLQAEGFDPDSEPGGGETHR